MRISEKIYKAMPPELQALFVKLPNPGSDEVMALFPVSNSNASQRNRKPRADKTQYRIGGDYETIEYGDTGSAARFFYTAKASRSERDEGNNHPTVKPLDLMKYLIQLVTPPGGIVLDPFMGSGSTLIAARGLGFHAIGIEIEEQYCELAVKRLQENEVVVKRKQEEIFELMSDLPQEDDKS